MKKPIKPNLFRLTICLLTAFTSSVFAGNEYKDYVTLDSSDPISFDGNKVSWQGKTFTLDGNTIFLDYRLEESKIANNPFAFNNIQDAVKVLKNGTAEKPMLLLAAPGVYWVDNPDNAEIRVPNPGENFPTGLQITCDFLYFYGLNTKPENVVFAVNRGQTQGASGNFTMFSIIGKGLKSENVTFGNFCNVDLEFPLSPELSRKKRSEAIAQAQLFMYRNRDGVAINSHFISRLNLLPFATTYLNCHLESSGHASFFNSVYIGCSLEFYNVNFASGKFFDCDIYLMPFTSNYKNTKVYTFGFVDGRGNGLACVDTRFHRSAELVAAGIPAEISWDRTPQTFTTRSYQNNVTLDGKPYVIQEFATPGASVVIPDKSELLKAYKINYKGKTSYNVPNILSGVDPFDYTTAIKSAALADGKAENDYLNIPMNVLLRLNPGSNSTIRSKQSEAILSYGVLPTEYSESSALGNWYFKTKNPSNSKYVNINDNKNGTVTVSGTNFGNEAVNVILIAANSLGIEAAMELTIEPPYTEAPDFIEAPEITNPKDGLVQLKYKLELNGLNDESLITWYRCKDAEGNLPLKVSVSRRNNPETTYTLTEGDIGFYLMATIQPKHNRCEPGKSTSINSGVKIKSEDVKFKSIKTDFHNLPTEPQPLILPGTWTLDGYFAPECYDNELNPPTPRYEPNPDSWRFVEESDNRSPNTGLEPGRRGARLFYEPAGSNFGNMNVKALFAPKKTSGAGFGSATDQFLDVFIKFNLESMTGYALRIERLDTREINDLGFNGDGAVAGCAFSLISYENGKTTLLTKKIMSSAFVTESLVEINVLKGKLEAKVTSNKGNRSGDIYNFPREVHLESKITETKWGGTGMLFTGTTGSNSVTVLNWETNWE